MNGGATWSSWYNQPTAQLYHVSTDDRFPYWVYGGQQESGSVGDREPGRRRRDHVPRLASRRAPRSTGTSRPTRSTPTSSTAGKLTRFRHSTGDVAGRLARAAPRQVPVPAHGARRLLARRPARPLLRGQRPLPDGERRQDLGRRQPGPLARDAGRAGVDRRLPDAGDGEAAAPRRHLHRRARRRRT